jgi:hypothetical protein
MNQRDYRTVDVEKDAEKPVCDLFDLFGYKLFSDQEIRLDPFAEANEIRDLYDRKTVNEAFCGFHIPKRKLPDEVDSYVKLTFVRERLNTFFPYYLREEQNFLRLAFDSSFLGERILAEKKKRFIPAPLLTLYILFAVLGLILFVLGLTQGGSSGGAALADAAHAEYFFGIIFLVAGVSCILFDTLVRRIVHYEKGELYKRDKEMIDAILEKLLLDLRATDVYPHIDFDAVGAVEKKNAINKSVF